MTRNWTNYSANSGLTAETRSHMQQLEADLATGTGFRQEVYTVSFSDVNAHAANGIVPLTTLALTEALIGVFFVVTQAFNDSQALNSASVCPASNTENRISGVANVSAADSVADGLYDPGINDAFNFVKPSTAAVPLSTFFCQSGTPNLLPVGDGTTGSLRISLLITTAL